jgi:hypothetical protein
MVVVGVHDFLPEDLGGGGIVKVSVALFSALAASASDS